MTTENEKKSLLAYARAILEDYLGHSANGDGISPHVQSAPAGLFVTIYAQDEVRGSMGNVILHDALPQAIARLTLEAASQAAGPSPAKKGPTELRLEMSFISPLKRVFHIEDIEPQH